MRTFFTFLLICLGCEAATIAPVAVFKNRPASGAVETAWVTAASFTGVPRNNFTGCVGCRFTNGVSTVTISQLGCWVTNGNTATINIKIHLVSDDSVIASGSINPTGLSGWQYVSATGTLAANTAYYLMRDVTASGDFWIDENTTTTTAVATLYASYFATSCTAYSLSAANKMYAGVTFKYTSP